MSESSLSQIDSIIENNREIDLDLTDIFNKSCTISTINKNLIMQANTENRSVPTLDIKNLSIIPNFDGNPNKLHRFINSSESILCHYFDSNNPNNFQNILLLNGILNKLEGRAEEVVSITGASDWGTIKRTLIQNFGDQRDENCLNLDLVNMKQRNNETPFQFHERIIHILNTICNYIDLHSDNDGEKIYKREFFRKQALKSFLAGLREPLGPIIRAMRPTTIAQAVQFISEENNIKYYQNANNQLTKPQNNSHSQRNPNHFNAQRQQPSFRLPQNQQPQFRQFLSQPSTSNQFPTGPINIRPYMNQPPQRFPTNSQVFGKPKNNWQPRPQIPQQRPQPMSVCTSTVNNKPPQFNSPRFNHFANVTNCARPGVIIEEVFNTEFNEQPECSDDNHSEISQFCEETVPVPEADQYYDSYYSGIPLDETQNFQENPPSDSTT